MNDTTKQKRHRGPLSFRDRAILAAWAEYLRQGQSPGEAVMCAIYAAGILTRERGFDLYKHANKAETSET
jgi:hypothetical protein